MKSAVGVAYSSAQSLRGVSRKSVESSLLILEAFIVGKDQSRPWLVARSYALPRAIDFSSPESVDAR